MRATEQAVQDRIQALDGDSLRIVDAEGNSRPVARPRNEQIASLEQELRTALGTKVDLSQTAKGRGKITIHFKSHEEFARLRQILSAGTAAKPSTSAKPLWVLRSTNRWPAMGGQLSPLAQLASFRLASANGKAI